jgi:hypothetical protein
LESRDTQLIQPWWQRSHVLFMEISFFTMGEGWWVIIAWWLKDSRGKWLDSLGEMDGWPWRDGWTRLRADHYLEMVEPSSSTLPCLTPQGVWEILCLSGGRESSYLSSNYLCDYFLSIIISHCPKWIKIFMIIFKDKDHVIHTTYYVEIFARWAKGEEIHHKS